VDVDLARLPVQHCWPGDVAPLITWGLVIYHSTYTGKPPDEPAMLALALNELFVPLL